MPTLPRLQPNRKIEGISGVLPPFHMDGSPDLAGFAAHLERSCSISGCYPLNEFHKGRLEARVLKQMGWRPA